MFTYLAITNVNLFTIGHAVVWYAGSTLLVVGIWLWTMHHYKIQAIPFYTDMRSLYKEL